MLIKIAKETLIILIRIFFIQLLITCIGILKVKFIKKLLIDYKFYIIRLSIKLNISFIYSLSANVKNTSFV